MTNLAVNLTLQQVIRKFRKKRIYSEGTVNIKMKAINVDGLIFKISKIQQKGENRKTS